MHDRYSWDKDGAEIRAREFRIGPLAEDHCKVINLVLDYYSNRGQGPMPYEMIKKRVWDSGASWMYFPAE